MSPIKRMLYDRNRCLKDAARRMLEPGRTIMAYRSAQ